MSYLKNLAAVVFSIAGTIAGIRIALNEIDLYGHDKVVENIHKYHSNRVRALTILEDLSADGNYSVEDISQIATTLTGFWVKGEVDQPYSISRSYAEQFNTLPDPFHDITQARRSLQERIVPSTKLPDKYRVADLEHIATYRSLRPEEEAELALRTYTPPTITINQTEIDEKIAQTRQKFQSWTENPMEVANTIIEVDQKKSQDEWLASIFSGVVVGGFIGMTIITYGIKKELLTTKDS